MVVISHFCFYYFIMSVSASPLHPNHPLTHTYTCKDGRCIIINIINIILITVYHWQTSNNKSKHKCGNRWSSLFLESKGQYLNANGIDVLLIGISKLTLHAELQLVFNLGAKMSSAIIWMPYIHVLDSGNSAKIWQNKTQTPEAELETKDQTCKTRTKIRFKL